jgi:hypothetical protein
MARRHEQAVASGAAEAKVGAALGQRNEADQLAGGVENLDPVLLGVTHAPAAPEIALDVAAEAVGGAARLSGDEGAAIGELVVVDVVMGVAFEMTRAAFRLDKTDPIPETVAKKIIELANAGVRDPDQLCELALNDLRRRRLRI